ncbi:MAG TPA: hypothetical protein VHT04_14860 [Stellaceae bacterium]|nr:hypothetical protein [Stellaceae bacterium]
MGTRHLIPRPPRTWLRNRRRLRHANERHPVPTLTAWEKRQHLIEWVRRSGVRVFVETGTYRGETTLALREVVRRCVTIELDPALHAGAREIFTGMSDVELLHGDSGALIRDVMAGLDEPALFWLDAHYSGSGTARGIEDSPILGELHSILSHRIKEHIVIVDDAREFVGDNGYPTIRRLAKFVEGRGYAIRIRGDLIRIYAGDDL